MKCNFMGCRNKVYLQKYKTASFPFHDILLSPIKLLSPHCMFWNFRKELSFWFKLFILKKYLFFGVHSTLDPTWAEKIWLGTSSVCFGYIGELLMKVNKKQQVDSISDMSPFQNKSTSNPVSSTKSSYFSLIFKMIQQLSQLQWRCIQQWILLDINTLLFGSIDLRHF